MGCEAKDVLRLELRDPSGAALAEWTPGAHVEIRLPNGLIRHYSLCGEPADHTRYVIAVGLDARSRGGSRLIHDTVRVGTSLSVNELRNNFPFTAGTGPVLFVAGGIGVTPIVAMVRAASTERRPWRLLYAARSRQRAAFYEELRAIGAERCTFHFDDERGGVVPDVAAALAQLPSDGHVFCCGPVSMMDAVREATEAAGRDPHLLHVEYFATPQTTIGDDTMFTIGLRSTGQTLEIPPGQSILEVLESAGVPVPFSCREGLCATCKTRVLSGTPDHRDTVLSPAQRARGDVMTVCVSRSLTPHLDLAL